MTDHFAGFTVTLDKTYRDDDSEAIINAIKMIKGVAGVEPVVADAGFYMAKQQARWDLQKEMREVLFK